MNWDAFSAVGTVLAALVGIAGIWLNQCDKRKKLMVTFETAPEFCVYASNSSLRSVIITKMVCSIDDHFFYVKLYDGLHEVCLPPASVKKIEVRTSEIYDEYLKSHLDALCNPKDEVVIIIYDNYGR